MFDLLALWAFELGVLAESVASGSPFHAWLFTSVRSSSDSFRLNREHAHVLHFVSLELVLAL
ncbi:hypothetical protein AUI46_00560 [archaeon 13_1_40CM_2_52_13]|nr:MAG: hypothetical protein AUI46_00560 [archaeon 13_1_40CM_2_52_13]OLE90055.1 MAG: hypothetical protein AUF79_11085 [Crenarchaeota archaeon 13_1_20CM_2_51_8]TMI39887.1 MAG: hypothetical protein E6H21_07910 [Candidatus Bathyarchaeota archaeon]